MNDKCKQLVFPVEAIGQWKRVNIGGGDCILQTPALGTKRASPASEHNRHGSGSKRSHDAGVNTALFTGLPRSYLKSNQQ